MAATGTALPYLSSQVTERFRSRSFFFGMKFGVEKVFLLNRDWTIGGVQYHNLVLRSTCFAKKLRRRVTRGIGFKSAHRIWPLLVARIARKNYMSARTLLLARLLLLLACSDSR